MKQLKVIAFTHKNIDLKDVGRFHVEPDQWELRLNSLKATLKLNELMYLSTCNRVEFIFSNEENIGKKFLHKFFSSFNPSFTKEDIDFSVHKARVFEGEAAMFHILEVASSMDSLVVGEREIITQVRTAYERCRELGLTGDVIRLLIKKAVECAKQVFTETTIAQNPVSVVSLAYHDLKKLNIREDARILVIGAGQTNTNMCKFLKKHGYRQFTIFNRSLDNAQKLASIMGGEAYTLDELKHYDGGFDVMIACTGAEEPIVDVSTYHQLLQGENDQKVVIDLAVPNDVEEFVFDTFNIHAIRVSTLKDTAAENLEKRRQAIAHCDIIIRNQLEDLKLQLRHRMVEVAMKEVPRVVKEIRQHAIQNVFAREMETLDKDSRAVLERMMEYMEKKYISVPMKMAKDILLEKN
ncbi:MAG: glutamyl-tRNA reductase [Flavobacteriales bacterium]